MKLAVLLLAIAAVAGCKKKGPPAACAAYVEVEDRCRPMLWHGVYEGLERGSLEACTAALQDETTDWNRRSFYEEIQAGVTCARSKPSCEDYRTCTDRAEERTR